MQSSFRAGHQAAGPDFGESILESFDVCYPADRRLAGEQNLMFSLLNRPGNPISGPEA
jgi:hypothetical protein